MFDPRDMLRRVPLWVVCVVFQQNVFPPVFAFSAPPSKFGYGQTGRILANTAPWRTARWENQGCRRASWCSFAGVAACRQAYFAARCCHSNAYWHTRPLGSRSGNAAVLLTRAAARIPPTLMRSVRRTWKVDGIRVVRPPTTIKNHGSCAKVREGDTQLRGSCPAESDRAQSKRVRKCEPAAMNR
jgi:hypothetical protein